jgi:hypothetical protein
MIIIKKQTKINIGSLIYAHIISYATTTITTTPTTTTTTTTTTTIITTRPTTTTTCIYNAVPEVPHQQGVAGGPGEVRLVAQLVGIYNLLS